MNLITKAMQIIAAILLASAGLLHLATFFVAVPGFSAVAFVLLVASVALAAMTYMSLWHFTFFTFYAILPYRTKGFFARMAEDRERKVEIESRIYSHISQKWSAILGTAGGYLFLNGMFCFYLYGAQTSVLSDKTVESKARGELLSDCYTGRFLSGCALLPATFAVMGFHVIFPKLIEESQQNPSSPLEDEKSLAARKKINKLQSD